MYSKTFMIDLKGLKADETVWSYNLGNEFFDAIEESTIKEGAVQMTVTLRKCAGSFELLLKGEGEVTVPCDRCLDDMSQPIAIDHRLVVKLGAEEIDDDDVIVVNEDDGVLDLLWLMYEYIVLAVPLRHVHAPGGCNAEMEKFYCESASDESDEAEASEETDPRWEALKNLTMDD